MLPGALEIVYFPIKSENKVRLLVRIKKPRPDALLVPFPRETKVSSTTKHHYKEAKARCSASSFIQETSRAPVRRYEIEAGRSVVPFSKGTKVRFSTRPHYKGNQSQVLRQFLYAGNAPGSSVRCYYIGNRGQVFYWSLFKWKLR